MIFLSASIPDPKRNQLYFQTADIVAIRDAVRALATVVIPNSNLVWGGHPAITPLIRYVMYTINTNVQEHITIYQSNFFAKNFPKDNEHFENIVIVPEIGDREESLYEMRKQMLSSGNFRAGIFIGGMEGVEIEYNLFKELYPEAIMLPVASTGGAAKIIYNSMEVKPSKRLINDYAYMNLFKSLLKSVIS